MPRAQQPVSFRGEQTASAMTVVTDALQACFLRQIALNAVLCSAVESFF